MQSELGCVYECLCNGRLEWTSSFNTSVTSFFWCSVSLKRVMKHWSAQASSSSTICFNCRWTLQWGEGVALMYGKEMQHFLLQGPRVVFHRKVCMLFFLLIFIQYFLCTVELHQMSLWELGKQILTFCQLVWNLKKGFLKIYFNCFSVRQWLYNWKTSSW